MKRLLLISTLLLITSSLYSQRSHYYKNPFEKAWTFQVSADVIDYDGVKYGWSMGANYKELISLNYFHTRDYKSTETSWMDSRFGGLHGSVVLPIGECIQMGAGVRLPYLNRGNNRQSQKTIYSAEVRMDLGTSTKIAFEYGGSSTNSISSVRLIWNMY